MVSRAKVWINPLSLGSIEEPDEETDVGGLIRDLSRDYKPDALSRVRTRCLRLATPELSIPFVPAEARTLDKIVWPLRSAKQAFGLGDFLACIALCGTVCEMATVFTYDLIAGLLKRSRLSPKGMKLFRTQEFETWGQEKRLKKLLELGIISQPGYENAESVRKIRRRYLHFLTKPLNRSEQDAHRAYVSTCGIVKELIFLVPGPNGLLVPKHLMDYLKRQKTISDEARDTDMH